MADIFKVPLVLTAQPEGGYTVTSPTLPELVTEGETPEQALENVRDALVAVLEIYEDLWKPFPARIRLDPHGTSIQFDGVVTRP